MQFLGDVFTLVLHWLAGEEQADVVGLAWHLDGQVTGGALGLEEFVSVPTANMPAITVSGPASLQVITEREPSSRSAPSTPRLLKISGFCSFSAQDPAELLTHSRNL